MYLRLVTKDILLQYASYLVFMHAPCAHLQTTASSLSLSLSDMIVAYASDTSLESMYRSNRLMSIHSVLRLEIC